MSCWYDSDLDYYSLGEYEEDIDLKPAAGVAPDLDGGAQSIMPDGNEGNLNQEVYLGLEGDVSDPEPREQEMEEGDFLNAALPQRRGRRRRSPNFQFTLRQVEEMEDMFGETQYPDILMRRELARAMNVPEVKIKVWFNNRRAKQRKLEKRELLRALPPGTEDYIFITEVKEF